MITLMQGDCLERMKEIEAGSVDMVLTDPPYGTTACKWDTVIDLPAMWAELKRIVKPNGAIVMTASQPFTSALVMSNPKMYRHQWIWNKVKASGHLNAKIKPMTLVEDVVVFSKNTCTYFPIMTHQTPRISKNYIDNKKDQYGLERNVSSIRDSKYPSQIIVESNANQKGKVHPTQKPVALMEYLVRTYTSEGETVLDFTMGSGTTGVACKNLRRKFIGIELDPEYYVIAQKRIQESQGEDSTR